MNKGKESKFRGKMSFPHTYVIIMSIVLLAALLTYVIPAGQYERVKDEVVGKTIVVADQFEYVENTPVSLFDIPDKIVASLNKSSSIIFIILIVGGAFQVIIATGVFQVFTTMLTKKFSGNENIIIPAFVTIFALACTSMGVNTFIGFAPIAIILARSMGFDALVGVSMVMLGGAIGFGTGTLNPFSTGVAQTIAELPMFSGIGFRFASLVVFLIVTNIYIIRYAKKIRSNPESSIVFELEQQEKNLSTGVEEFPKAELKHFLVLAVVVGAFACIMYGSTHWGWKTNNNSAMFIWMAIIGGFAGGMGPSRVATEFVSGARKLVFGALLIGIARATSIILVDGNILDTVVRSLASGLLVLPGPLRAVGMFFSQIIINCFIVSGSGQAAVTMPIMIPVADLVGVTRQTAVLAFNFGDGFSNYVLPTSSALMGMLAISNIPYDRWMKYMWKLFGIWVITGSALLLIAYAINYGPF
ncbi:YfcC family protein [Gottschalkiaceae bacterium SANA]|nr:YfcC family protein [Gottschalkiaceae bacterium SANA]